MTAASGAPEAERSTLNAPLACVQTTPSFTDQTKADLDEIVASAADSDDDIGPDAEAAMAAAARAEKRRALLPYFALAAGLMAVFFLTPLGPWLSAEFEVVSVAAQKVSGVASAVMDKIPWPQPHHGEEGLYVTIAILMTSVIVRHPSSHPACACLSCGAAWSIAKEPGRAVSSSSSALTQPIHSLLPIRTLIPASPALALQAASLVMTLIPGYPRVGSGHSTSEQRS